MMWWERAEKTCYGDLILVEVTRHKQYLYVCLWEKGVWMKKKHEVNEHHSQMHYYSCHWQTDVKHK